MAWPTQVPILNASDICRDEYDRGEQHCLLGWASKIFHNWEFNQVFGALWEVAGSPSEFNDDRQNTKTEIAAAWNLVMRQLGYTEECERE